MAAMISVVSGGAVVDARPFSSVKSGKVARIAATKGARYVLADAPDGSAVADVKASRAGNDLVLEQGSDDTAQTTLIIEGFFGSDAQLVGVGAQGEYLLYLSANDGGATDVAQMADGAGAFLSLPVAQPSAVAGGFQFSAGEGSVLGGALAALAGGMALMNGKSGGAVPQAAPAASSFVLDDAAIASASNEAPPMVAGLETIIDHTQLENSIADEEVVVAEPVALADEDGEAVEQTLAIGDIKNKTKPAISLTDGAAKLAAGGVAFSIDDTPVIEAVLDDQGAIQGVVENGAYTDDGRPQIVGKAESGVLVHIYRGSELIGQVTAGANGEWSFTPRLPLADGRHILTILHEYADGDVSDVSAPYVIHVDKSVPDAPIISGMVDDEGRITGTITEQMITDDNRPTINGTAEAHATVIVYDKGKEIGSVKVGADGKWSFTPVTALADGTHLLSYATVDRAGNGSERTTVFEFVVDTRPEKINIFVADDNEGRIQGEIFTGSVTDDSTPTLMGSATAGGVVKIYEGNVLLGQVVADVDGTWRFTPPAALAEGAHTFHATVTLVAKGESERSKPFNLTVDQTAPDKPSIEQVLDDAGAIIGLVARGQSTDDSTPTLSGTAEKGSTVHIHDNGNLLGTVVADANGSWVFTPTAPLGDGPHDFTVTAEDKAGNVSGSSDPFAIVIDTVPAIQPTIDSVYDDTGSKTGNLASGEETDDYRPDISGTADAGSTVIIKDNGAEIGRVQANGEGKWTFTPQENLAEGGHKLTAESVTTDGKLSLPSDSFDFSVVQNGDDNPREIIPGTAMFNTTVMVDTSGSMATPIASVKTALKQLASEYLGAAGGQPVTLTMLTMSSPTPVKYIFSSVSDADYVKYMAAVDALTGYGAPDYEAAIKATMNSIKADHLAGNGPNQVLILGDAQNGLTQATATQWQAMLLNPTGSAALSAPIQSTPISFAPFHPTYEYSFHWLASGGKAIDMPAAEMLPEILLGATVGDVIVGNLLDNDAKITQDGNEYLTQMMFEGATFRIAPNNTLVMANVPVHVKGAYDPATGLLTITTQSGALLVYMRASAGHAAGEYVYQAKLAQLYHGESSREETFGYLAVDGGGASQSANLHIVLQPSDARDLLRISTLGKDSGTQGDFVTFDGSAGREISGTLSQFLATGMTVQVSVDGGKTWQDAVTHGKNWSFIDMAAHSSSWTIQVRVTDGVTHGTQVLSQEVTLVAAPAAPVITSIPEAASVYSATLAQNGTEMTVALTGTGAKVGDTVHIQWGSSTYDQVLTAVNIANDFITLNVPATVTYNTASYNYDFAVTAQIIGQDGALGAVSKPFDVVGTYARAALSDTLQLAPVGNVYTGNGVTVTTTGTMAKTAATTNSVAGLTLSDSLQANAKFTLNKPADYISLRLSGADNALGAHIRVYDVSGNLMYEQTVFGGTTAQHLATFTWTKTGTMDIGSFTVTAMSASVTLDSFTQYVVTHTADSRDPNLIDILTETFYGSAGNDVVSLAQTSAAYFGQATAAVHGGAGTDTLKLMGGTHVLNLTTAGSKISSMEIIDLTGTGNNTLTESPRIS